MTGFRPRTRRSSATDSFYHQAKFNVKPKESLRSSWLGSKITRLHLTRSRIGNHTAVLGLAWKSHGCTRLGLGITRMYSASLGFTRHQCSAWLEITRLYSAWLEITRLYSAWLGNHSAVLGLAWESLGCTWLGLGITWL